MMDTVQLWEQTPGMCEEIPVLDIYIPENKTTDIAVVIMPGGGYRGRAPHEGKGYAEFLNAHGIAAFVCQYRVAPHRFPLPLLDARRAIRYVRYFSEKFGISKEKVYIMGSSAGGHLSAMTSTYREPIEFEGLDDIDRENPNPNGQILCYPVIKLLGKGVAHLGSGMNLLGDKQAEMGEELSPDLIADENTPKAFIWHTFSDPAVNVINSLDYAKRLRQMNVPVEMHIYPEGPHGLGLAPAYPHVADWAQRLIAWLKFYEEKENG